MFLCFFILRENEKMKIIDYKSFIKKNLQNKKVVFTNGCFDILHTGHIKLLKEAKSLGDILIVGLNTDYSIKKLKGDKRPIKNEKTRSIILESIKFVDFVILFNESSPIKLIKKIKPDVLVKGSEYNKKEIIGYDFMIHNKGKVHLVEMEKNISSSNIINNIKTN